MAQSMTFTYLDADHLDGWNRTTRVKVLQVDWISDGAADLSPGESEGMTTRINGVLTRAVFDPGAGPPTALYDVVVEDTYGADILLGQGANLSAAVIDHRPVKTTAANEDSYYQTAVDGTIHVHVTAAGNDTEGRIWLFFHS